MKEKGKREGANLDSTLKKEDNHNYNTLTDGQKRFDASLRGDSPARNLVRRNRGRFCRRPCNKPLF